MLDAIFDEVQVPGGRSLSATEFLSLPVSERIRIVLQREARFTRAGEHVDPHAALQALMKRAQSAD